MQRGSPTLGQVEWLQRARRLAGWLNPVLASPAAPAESLAAINALAPSLMPRTSRLDGIVIGCSVLGARAVTSGVESLARTAAPADATLRRQLLVRGLIGAAGAALARIPERDGQHVSIAAARSAGLLIRAGAAGGAVHEVGRWLQQRHPGRHPVRQAVVGAASAALLLNRTRRRRPQDRAGRPAAATVDTLATAAIVTAAGTIVGRSFVRTGQALEAYLGPGRSKQLLARMVNAGTWTAAATAGYLGGVAHVGRNNQRLEPGYATPPESPLVSGSSASLLPFSDLGQEGRRFVTDVVTPDLIEAVMGEPALSHPIRTYVGFNSEPLYQAGRAELALAELARTGAFERSHLLLVSPTGTGWVDQAMIEAAEFLTRGDIATCCIQYARYPSFLSVQKVALGRGQFRLLLWGVKQRLEERPPERRPRVLVFGESMGAWTSSDVLMYQGIDGFDHYGIERALWVGLPWLAKWSRSGMARGSSTLVPPSTVRVFDRHEQLAELSAEDRARLRAIVLSHDNDPIAVLGPDVIVQRPAWLAHGDRGRGVPSGMSWMPLITFIHTATDAFVSMLAVPGEFRSHGHDYRADMAGFVRDAYGFPAATDEQLARIQEVLQERERERAARILSGTVASVPAGRAEGPVLQAGVPIRGQRLPGARWVRRRDVKPPAPAATPAC
jgi:uncharacterized membrane protein